jgi:hypothetical protein
MNALRSRPQARAVVLDSHHYELLEGPDRGQFYVLRDGASWAFVRRGDEGQWIGNTVEGWIEPTLVARIMAGASRAR